VQLFAVFWVHPWLESLSKNDSGNTKSSAGICGIWCTHLTCYCILECNIIYLKNTSRIWYKQYTYCKFTEENKYFGSIYLIYCTVPWYVWIFRCKPTICKDDFCLAYMHIFIIAAHIEDAICTTMLRVVRIILRLSLTKKKEVKRDKDVIFVNTRVQWH
jgi:hypothetical protein